MYHQKNKYKQAKENAGANSEITEDRVGNFLPNSSRS